MSEVTCAACGKAGSWVDLRKAQRFSSPLMKVGEKLVHRCCLSKYIDVRKKDGRTQMRIKPKFLGVPLWRRVMWSIFGEPEA